MRYGILWFITSGYRNVHNSHFPVENPNILSVLKLPRPQLSVAQLLQGLHLSHQRDAFLLGACHCRVHLRRKPGQFSKATCTVKRTYAQFSFTNDYYDLQPWLWCVYQNSGWYGKPGYIVKRNLCQPPFEFLFVVGTPGSRTGPTTASGTQAL